MVEKASLNNITPYGADHEQGESVPEHHETPWVTYAVICLCGSLWVYLNFADNLPPLI
ncbi:MAG: hypothetical protein Q3M30_01985 [Candidatus Electrothrix sp. Rat3]|nr:hypothetical protein [Candidatus Electrothrix rattekaaiensis]